MFYYRFKKSFPKKQDFTRNEKTTEENNEIKEGTKNEQSLLQNPEMIEVKNKNLIEIESFYKLSPEEQKEILSKRIPTKKIRCKNWPNCNDPNCIYTHPTETVS